MAIEVSVHYASVLGLPRVGGEDKGIGYVGVEEGGG